MTTLNIHEGMVEMTALLAAIEQNGEPILICRNGTPVAELRPTPPATGVDRLRTYPDLKPLWVAPDFDASAPLTADEWPEELR